jgi:transcriptional regulator with XRE-family HTH domain
MNRFGEKLFALRTKRGYTIRELGDRLGVYHTYISQMEKGKKIPNAAMLLKLADLFCVSTDILMRDEVDLP